MITSTGTNGKHVVRYGGVDIPFTVEFRERQRLAIHVHPDRSVTVIAPIQRGIDDVLARVQKRAGWIAKQRSHFEQFHPLPSEKRYVSGETHLYLGRQYRLKVGAGGAESVKLKGRYLQVATADRSNTQRVRALLDDWYRTHAEPIFEARLIQCLEDAPSLRMPPPTLVIKRMSKRWGSCTKTGNVLINLDLIKTPLYCIEYLIMHELCHLRIHNHSPGFYRLLSRCMPDWERRKARLDSFVI